MFCDGIRPGSDLTNLDNDFDYNNTKTKRSEKSSMTAGNPKRNLPAVDPETNTFIPTNENCLPPTVTISKTGIYLKTVVAFTTSPTHRVFQKSLTATARTGRPLWRSWRTNRWHSPYTSTCMFTWESLTWTAASTRRHGVSPPRAWSTSGRTRLWSCWSTLRRSHSCPKTSFTTSTMCIMMLWKVSGASEVVYKFDSTLVERNSQTVSGI